MSDPKCETCKHYHRSPIVKREGECTEPSKIIYVRDSAQNEAPHVFDFSSCRNHETAS